MFFFLLYFIILFEYRFVNFLMFQHNYRTLDVMYKTCYSILIETIQLLVALIDVRTRLVVICSQKNVGSILINYYEIWNETQAIWKSCVFFFGLHLNEPVHVRCLVRLTVCVNNAWENIVLRPKKRTLIFLSKSGE